MAKISLLFCFIVLVTLCTAQTYGDLEFPSTTTVTNFNPCTQLYYTFTIPPEDFTGTNYLEISIEGTSALSYAISETELTYGDLDDYIPFGSENATVNIVCNFNSTSWYLVIANEGDVQVNFTLAISAPFVGVTPLEIGEKQNVNTNGYDFSSFESTSDFYGITFTNYAPQFSALEITIISTDPNNTVSSAQINFRGLPSIGCQSSVEGSEKTVIFVDYCTLQSNVIEPNFGTYFVSVTPENENTLSYSIEVANPAPVVTNLPTGTVGLTGYLLAVGETNFYSINANEGNVLNITLTDIINGELTVDVNYGSLPFFECVSSGNILSQDTSTSCQLIVDYCNSISGVYYIGVQAKSIDNPLLPISYRIFYNQFEVPKPESLEDNAYTTGVISQSFYSHYEFDSSNFDVDEDTLLNVRLYVDTYNLESASYEINLYANFDEPAGPLDSCWSSVAQCTIVTGNGESSCTIQIDPCLFNDHETWYASVFASDDLIESRVIQYTIIANLEKPTELIQEFEIISSSVYDQNYDHYYLPQDLFYLGSQVNIHITSVSNDVELYVNNDGTLAGEIVCPTCYNNTDSQSIEDDITYAVTSCPNAEIVEDFYFSIQGRNTNSFSSYSVMYSLPTGLVTPSIDLAPNSLAVGTIAPRSAVNYTLGISSFSSNNQLIVKFSSQNTTGDLTVTLYNTTYLNCLDGFELYSCTIEESGYCTFTVPPCVFTTSEGLIFILTNSDQNDPVHYNLEFSSAVVPTTTLTNGETIVSEIGQFQYDLYQYEVEGGAATFIVEVVFFDDGNYNPTGYLNISSLPLSTGPCYPDDVIFTCESDTKCVFVVSSCNFQGETLNIAVYTADELLPDLPLRYSIVAREFSPIVPLPAVVNSQSTYTGQIYPGQKVYHTFQSTPNAAAGSQVTFQLSGDVIAVISQNTPPTPSTCPCFEYFPGATIPNDSGNSFTLEYCEQLSGTYTILVETSLNQNPATLVTYTLVASTFSSQPVALVLDQPVQGQVILDYYEYFTLPIGSDAISVSVTNIVGGSIAIYYSGTGVATSSCSEGRITCTTPDTACVAQLPTCEDISYLSIYGLDADTASPITYTIVISAQNRTVLAEGDPTGNTTLPASFTNIYSFTINDEDYIAPIVTFSLTDISPGNANYQLSAYTNDLCSSDFVSSIISSSLSVPFCKIQDDDLFFYVTSLEATRTIAYTARVDVIDIADNTQTLALDTAATVDLDQGDWVTFTYSQPALNANEQSSLIFTISPPTTAYFSFGSVPAPQCSDDTFTSGTHVVDPCCLKEGDYYISFASSPATTTTYTVQVQSTVVSFTEQLQIGTPSNVVDLLPGQTAEFVFEVTNLDYDVLNIIVGSNQDVEVAFERITQAGDDMGTCYTNYQTTSCTDDFCAYQFEQCENNIVGTMYISITPSTASANVSVNVISSSSIDLTPDGNAVQLTAQARVEYVYSVSIPQDALLPNQELSVTITSNNVSFDALLKPSSTCGPTIDSCSDEEECTVTSLLCNTPEIVILTIIADADADITVAADIITEDPTELTEGTASNKPEDDKDINLYSFTIDNTTNLQYVTVSIVYDGLTNNFAASWRYYSPAPNGLYCLPNDDSENMCNEYIEDETNDITTCTFVIEPCELVTGNYLIQVIADNSDDTYTVTYSVSDATPTAINIGDVIYSTIDENQNLYYELAFDRSSILPGQSFEITLDVTCGDADLYINQGVLAGPTCSVNNDANFILDACDLLESSVTLSPSDPFYLTVAGGEPDFSEFGVPSSFSLSSAIIGQPINFVPIGPNQAIQFDGSPTIYTYNVAGINDFTGELAFTITLPSELIGASATVYVSADVPYHPLLPCTNEFTTLSSNQAQTSFFENSCTVDSVRIFYVSFDASSSENATFMVSRTKQFVRDLNEYDYYPQSGAVVGNPVSFNIVDEEYYEIEVDPTVPGFRFQATLSTAEFGHARLLTSLDYQPSECDTIDPTFTCSSQNTNSECEVDIEYCDFDVSSVPHVYLTVNTNFNSATPVPYNLSITQTVNQVTLTPNVAICGASNTTWTWYTLPSTATSNTFYEFQIYSVSLNEFVNVYLNTEGLATSRCKQYSSLACTGSCSIVYSCDGFTGSFSIGVEKSNIYTSYFIVANPITITPVPLQNQVSHSSDEDTPVAIDGTDYYFYSFAAPTLNVENGDSLILTVSSESIVSVSYNTNSPSINCQDDESAGTSVVFFVNSCNYVTGTIYVTVFGSSDFTIEYGVLTTNVSPIPLNSYVENSLALDFTDNEDSFPSFTAYSFTISDTDLTTYNAIVVDVYGINQGELLIWITENQIADLKCAVEIFDNADSVLLNTCDLTAGTYFINVLLVSGGQNSPCLPVTFGILVASESPVNPITVIPLVSGTASTSSIFFTNNLYTFTSAPSPTSVVSVTTHSSAPITVTNGCQVISTPVQYFFGCSAQTDYYFSVNPTPIDAFTPPNTTYDITATTIPIVSLTSTSMTGFFDKNYEAVNFYSFTVDSETSLEIFMNVTVGPSVDVQLWSSECNDEANILIDQFTCYFGVCVLPVSQRQGVVTNSTDSVTYYVTVSGYSPSAYNIFIKQGEEETCIPVNEDDLDFCTIVDWSTWGYSSASDIIQAQDATAERRFEYLYLKFCPPCLCEELSQECNTSLTEYVCTQTFRACDYEGFETSICLTSCQDVERNCGATFEEVGLPELSCNHNFYLTEDDPICTEIYQTTSSNSDLILWIVVGVVLFIVVVILLAVTGFVVYKQIQAKRRDSSYEVLE